jgi:peptide/nickel transport system substrate-binding protein
MNRLSRRALLTAPPLIAAATTAVRVAAEPVSRLLRVGIVSDPVTLDPAFAGSFFENQVLYNLHETLLVAHPDGTLEGGLAESWELPDKLRCVLLLRPGLTFHDGTPLDADAVRANFERLLDPQTGSIRRGDLGPLTEVAVLGPRTVELRLSEPYAPLPSILAGRAGMIVSPTALARLGPEFGARAVGCGAFRLVSWTRNSELVLDRFEGYWRGREHAFDRLVLRPLPDETARLANLRAGTVQLIDGVPPQAVDMIAHSPELSVARMPSIGFNAVSLNCTRPPFDDRRVRQAFAATIDPDVIQRLVYFGTGRIANGPIPPAIQWAFDPDFLPPRRDLEHARRLLAEAGIATPAHVTLTVTTAPAMLRIAQILQAQAGEAGFAVQLRQVDPTILLSVLKHRDFDVAMSPWSGRFDPDGNMFVWFARGGFANFSGYDDEGVTDLLHAARASSDQAERAALYRRAQARVVQDAPVIFLHFDAILQAATARLHWTLYPDGVLRLFDAWMT